MSLYLHVARININQDGTIIHSKPYDNLDIAKYVGDRELLDSGLLDKHIYSKYFEESYYRPTNFNLTSEWVDIHVPEGNRNRLHYILNELQNDPELYFYYS